MDDEFEEYSDDFIDRDVSIVKMSELLEGHYKFSNASLCELQRRPLSPQSERISPLIEKHEIARGKQLIDLECKDIRLLVGQKTGLKWLAKPVAIFVILHPRAQCTFYNGDLTLCAIQNHAEFYEYARKETVEMLNCNYDWFDEEFDYDKTSLLEARNSLDQATDYISNYKKRKKLSKKKREKR